MPPKQSLLQFNRTVAIVNNVLTSVKGNVDALQGLPPLQARSQAEFLESSLKAELENYESFMAVYISSDILCEGLTEEVLQSSVSTIRGKFRDLLCLVSKYTCLAPAACSTVVDNNGSMNLNNSSVVLPKFTINKFNGNYTDFDSFLARFQTLVDSSTNLTISQKFEYLLSHLEGSALNVVKHLPFREENYEAAIKLLKERFSNNRRTVSIHANAILDLPFLSDDVDSIRGFIDQHQVNFSSLEQFTKNKPETHVQDLVYVQYLLAKFPRDMRDLFEKSVANIDFPSDKDVMDFLQRHVRALENASLGSTVLVKASSSSRPNKSKGFNKSKPYSSLATAVDKQCSICPSNDHNIFSCPKFSMLVPRERFKMVKSKGLCVRCLLPLHKGNACANPKPCESCGLDGHNSLLHFTDRPAEVANVACMSARDPRNMCVLLPTALVRVQVSPTQYVIARALLDSCSHACFVTENLVQKLNCSRFSNIVPISGIGCSSTSTKGQCMLTVCDLKGKVVTPNRPFHILSDITADNPRYHVSPTVLKRAKRYILADPTFHIPSRVDLLLSADVVASSLLGPVVPLGDGLPVVVLTSFGSVVMGSSPMSASSHVAAEPSPAVLGAGLLPSPHRSSIATLLASDDDRLCDSVQKFWSLENVPSVRMLSADELECERYFNDTTQRLDSGRYQVRLPFRKNGKQLLGDSYNNAFSRLRSLERRFKLDPGFKNLYFEFMADYEAKGHMKLVTDLSLPRYFIPHHGVYKTRGDNSKIRVVFDASSKSSTSHSLNSVLLPAPNVLALLSDILTLFRLCQFVFSCDVEQMYRQIMVHPEDIPYQCILWRDNEGSEIKCYALSTVTYGVGPSAYLAVATLLRLAKDEAVRFPRASRVLSRNTFVDDIHGGDNCLAKALSLRDELISLLSSGGFTLKKWASNSPTLLQGIPIPDRVPPDTIRVLGLVWNPDSDTFSFPVDDMIIDSDEPMTKRLVLAQTAKLYDPSGFASPVIMYAKCFFQNLWRLPLGWDDPIPFQMQEQWSGFKRSLCMFRDFTVPRLVHSYGKVQIHGFCDASQLGYSAVVYLRSFQGDTVRCSMISSKTRVAPLRPCSIPRLELLGAHLLAKLSRHYMNLLAADVQIDGVFLWTDSSIVLDWIRIEPHLLKTFVANRVAGILEWSHPSQWRHVPGVLNPADIASRGTLSVSDLTTLWSSGPSFLRDPPCSWPVLERSSHHSDEELELKGPITLVLTSSELEQDLFKDISTWSKVLRVASIIARWRQVVKGPSLNLVAVRCEALLLVIKHIQRQAFSEDLKALSKGKFPQPAIQRLAPFIDDKGVLRIKGRLANSSFSSRPCPILLPNKHRLVELLIQHYHVWLGHAGPSQVQFQLSWTYWILSARQVIRKVIHRCVRCFRASPRNSSPLMADLPAVRVNPSPPFWHSGMDYCGPFLVKPYPLRKATLVKVYLCIFICMSTKAVHLEVAHDLSSNAFIDVLKRFISRRGVPSHLYSDCGTNFVGTRTYLAKELTQLLSKHSDDTLIRDFLLSNNIEFSTIAPSAPHQGGLWERAVGSAKFHLKRVIGSSTLVLSQFITLCTQIEAILNSRPLTPLSAEAGDYSALTPAHFLIGRPLTSLPEEDLVECKDGSLRHYQLITAMVQRFWRQWRLEYLTTLQARSKWTKKTNNLQVGDIIIVNEPNCPPLMWPLGKVTQVFPGTDGIVRRVMVSTSSGLYERPAIKVYRLPIDDGGQSN